MSQCPFCAGTGRQQAPQPSASLRCPYCRCDLPLTQLFADAVTCEAVTRLAAVSLPLGERVTQYIMLFGPQQRPLTVARQVRLLLELLPDIERRAITYKGRDWQTPLRAWGEALTRILAARDAGKLDLPLTGHNYLYAILASLASAAEAKAEQETEQQRRNAVRSAPGAGAVDAAAAAAAALATATASATGAAAAQGAEPVRYTSLAVRRMQEERQRNLQRRERMLQRTQGGAQGSDAGGNGPGEPGQAGGGEAAP
ncbi:hypothetical protein EBQ34_00480 [Vandammella animalimorsus]|uniref:Uncharacterized protein n=1 Tax=Vandammella animalimorsus TaxID=2029117 RepID=A0A3M6RTK5_9BURK|nr:hypothetical protein [Vandammella animalimorsus]RMX18873.1 hypothetical protein EBQ34_00480 [Vandammella animalimorsus]